MNNNSSNSGCLIVGFMIIGLVFGFKAVLIVIGLLFSVFPFLLLVAVFLLVTNFLLKKNSINSFLNSSSPDHREFIRLLIAILVRLAKADGSVDRSEIKTIREYLQYSLKLSHQELLWTKEVIKEELRSTKTVEELSFEFKKSFSYEPRLILATLLYKVAFADGAFSAEEQVMINKIISILEISEYHHRSIKSQFFRYTGGSAQNTSDTHYYNTLGLETSASLDDIKKAYRELSRKYHPDKVAHLGKEISRVSAEKMKEINEAYTYLKQKNT